MIKHRNVSTGRAMALKLFRGAFVKSWDTFVLSRTMDRLVSSPRPRLQVYDCQVHGWRSSHYLDSYRSSHVCHDIVLYNTYSQHYNNSNNTNCNLTDQLDHDLLRLTLAGQLFAHRKLPSSSSDTQDIYHLGGDTFTVRGSLVKRQYLETAILQLIYVGTTSVWYCHLMLLR